MTQRSNHLATHAIAGLALDGQVARVGGLLISLVLVLLITTGGAG